MKEQQILEVLGTVDEKYIEEAAPGQRSPKPLLWVRWVSLAACLCLVAGGAALAASRPARGAWVEIAM